MYYLTGFDYGTKAITLYMEKGIVRFHNFQDVVLMISTNLYDKNCKEIYKNDIVRFDYNGINCIIGVIGVDKYGHSCINTKDSTEYGYHIENAINGEVIGNVFENKELLEV